jgi:secreted PhoX family phosphatase
MTDRPAFDAILAARLSRRTLLGGAASTVGLAAIAQIPAVAEAGRATNTFKSLAPRHDDVFEVADGYRWNVVARWGDSLVTGTPDFDTRRMSDNAWLDAAGADAQNRRFGTNADGAQWRTRVPRPRWVRHEG